MTPEQALEILDRVVSEVQTTRIGHMKIQEALNVIKKVLETKDGKNT